MANNRVKKSIDKNIEISSYTCFDRNCTKKQKTDGKACSNKETSCLELGIKVNCLHHVDESYKILERNNNEKIIILNRNVSMNLYGLMTVQLLYGNIEIAGYRLKDTSKKYKVYSPKGTSLLSICNIHDASLNRQEHQVSLQRVLLELEQCILYDEYCSVFRCTSLESTEMLFVEKHVSQQIFPEAEVANNADCLRCVFNFPGREVQIGGKWREIVNNISDCTKLMITGGKDVGKSTLLRFFVNALLNIWPKVRVIDLDPGQCEFTCPGCISIVTVDQPLLGCNYSHLKTPDRSFLTDVNVSNDPAKYVFHVKHLLNESEAMISDDIPIIVNTMGYTQGIGLNIAAAVVSIVQPTHLVEIQSANPKKNFKVPLRAPQARRNRRLLLPYDKTTLHFEYIAVESMCDSRCGWSLEARQFREMAILAYFGGLVPSKTLCILLLDSCIYRLSLSSIGIFDSNGDLLNPSVLNANLVALCSVKIGEKAVFQCHGWGIVRGVDTTEDYLILMTPEPMPHLERVVTCLVHNGVMLPASLYMMPESVTGEIPYVMQGELVAFGQFIKRTHISPKPVNSRAYFK